MPVRGESRLAVAALHERAGSYRLVVLTRSHAESPWQVAEARVLSNSELASIKDVCESHKIKFVVRVAPAAACICKTVDVPLGDPAQMAAAAGLLAEAELPPSVPAHRRAGALIPEVQRVGVRTGFLIGWLERGESFIPLEGVEERWTTPAAALAMLRGEARVAAFADSQSNAIVVLATGHERSVARVILAGEGEGSWAAAANEAIAETVQSVGLDAPPAIGDRRVVLEPASRRRLAAIAGVRDEPGWIDEFGIAMGAALLASDHEVAALASLHAAEPEIEKPIILRGAEWLTSGNRSMWVGVAASVAMLLVPWGLAWSRNHLLSDRTAVLEEMKATKGEIEKKAALYAQLEVSRWPMTKLLADLSGATPVGIVASDVRLSPEQGLAFQGTAEKAELVSSFQANLNKTKVFRNVKVNRVESSSSGGVEFNLAADIPAGQAHVPVTPAEDFASKSLAVRLHGEEAGAPSAAAPDKGDGKTAPARNGRRPRGEGRSPDEHEDSGAKPSSSDAPPPAVADADIEKMDLTTANRSWIARKVYVQKNPTLEASVKQRLQEEETKIRAHADKLKNAGGGK